VGTALTHQVWDCRNRGALPALGGNGLRLSHPDGSTPSAYERIAAYKTELAPYKVANAVRFMKEIPRNVAGKVMKRTLRETSEKEI